MARNVLHRRSHDVRLRDCRAQSPSRYSDQLPGKVRRPDEIPPGFGERVSAATHLFHSCGVKLRFPSCHVVLPCLQDGASPLSCQQRHHRFAGIMRCGGSINRLLCGEIRFREEFIMAHDLSALRRIIADEDRLLTGAVYYLS